MTSEKERSGCSVCGEAAVICLKESGRHLCGRHLKEDIEVRVASSIREYSMIRDGDRIAIGLSGGKDSTALLLLLHSLLPTWKNVSVVAITIDEGITGYREDTIGAAEAITRELGIEHHTVAFTDLFGGTLDTFLEGREQQACTVCGILRKKALVVAAERVNATRLATGHNLDDEAQSMLMNTLRGDLPRLVRESGEETGNFIPRIKPLRDISEKEIAAYLLVGDHWNDLPECPYTRFALRAEVRTILSGLEYQYPGTMKNLIVSRKKIREYVGKTELAGPIRHCKTCGDPCSGELCQVCQLLPSLKR